MTVDREQKLYRYYVSQSVIKGGDDRCPISRVPAADIERAVVNQLRVLLRSPEVVVVTWRAARKDIVRQPHPATGPSSP